jgi:hypothetical protein
LPADEHLRSESPSAGAPTAAAPNAKELFRRGAVYGLAGVMKATDVAVAAARGAVRGAREGMAEESDGGDPRTDSEPLPRELEHS